MSDPRFFRQGGSLTLAQLAKICGATASEGSDPDSVFVDVASLDAAGPQHVSFLDNRKYIGAFEKSRAGVCVVRPELAARAPKGMVLLLTPNPYRAYARIARSFYPDEPLREGIAPSAVIDPDARIGAGCEIEAGVVIGAGAEIGERCRIAPNAVIGAGVVVGEATEIGAGASLSHCLIGSHVLIHPGVRIGQRGFGFTMDPEGFIKVPQLGRVIVEDEVEIGANSTIDRGAGPDTVIGKGSMIDNLVQIGHNVEMGEGCVIVSQAGISGSTWLGKRVVLAAQAGLTGHLRIGEGVQIAAQSGVMRDVDAGAKVCGSPAVPIKQFFRQTATLAKLARKKGD
jgi:UDP-3-O-[3-hydroxymyristoyl] glucosamine N-acyltransferase